MTIHWEIRPATAADVPELLGLMQPFNASEQIPWHPERTDSALRKLIAEPELGFVLVAGELARALGYVIATYNYDLEWGGRDAFITELWVVPEARGCGVGQALLEAVEVHARAHGAFALHLAVRPENGSALRLYERVGYHPAPRIMLTKPLDGPPQ
jgi:ribosomal protein S18 acetylase RimI-like enzyme